MTKKATIIQGHIAKLKEVERERQEKIDLQAERKAKLDEKVYDATIKLKAVVTEANELGCEFNIVSMMEKNQSLTKLVKEEVKTDPNEKVKKEQNVKKVSSRKPPVPVVMHRRNLSQSKSMGNIPTTTKVVYANSSSMTELNDPKLSLEDKTKKL